MTNEIKLPHISDEDRQHLSYNPNTNDLVDWITEYATQAVTEDRAQRDADHLAELQAYELTVANLREQLAQRGEPVAWKWRFPDGDLSESPFESRSECERDAVGYDGEAIPLYTHPQTPQVPMTDDEIIEFFDKVAVKLGFNVGDLRAFTSGAVCAQAHHSIKEQP